MKTNLALILCFFALGYAAEDISPKANGVFDYHRTIGIPAAFKLREKERALENGQRIVGGSTTHIGVVPYQAGLIITALIILTSMCGGSLISDNTILTAAHCYTDGFITAQSITVVLGSNLLFTGGTRVQVQSTVFYPGYNPLIAANDIAVMRIPRVTFSLWIQAVSLPAGSELNQNFVGTTATASGYGITRDGDSAGLFQTINSVNLNVIRNEDCRAVFAEVQDQNLCTSGAGGVGICGGDTGGPLVVSSIFRSVIIGIGSFTASAGCQAGLPSGFTRVTSFVPWIVSV